MPLSAAKRFEPEHAKSEDRSVSSHRCWAAVQLAPLFVERKMPLAVPANRVVPFTARVLMPVSVKPEFI